MFGQSGLRDIQVEASLLFEANFGKLGPEPLEPEDPQVNLIARQFRILSPYHVMCTFNIHMTTNVRSSMFSHDWPGAFK